MAEFPSPRERVVASALLLLSTMPPQPSSSSNSSMYVFEFNDEESNQSSDVRNSKIKNWRGSLFSSDSKSCDSSISTDRSTEEISTRSAMIVPVASGRNELRFTALRKNRSKIHKSSNRWKFSSGESSKMTTSFGSGSRDVSCQSSSTISICSADSSTNSRYTTVGKGRLSSMVRAEPRRLHLGSAHIRRRAEGILNLLSYGSYSEVSIRQVLGDSPDTSKALRMLLKLEEVKRSGIGGRQDPYIYKIASHCRK
ncbi:uncharacterized protein LOC115711427 [Cannabis sativa]|uniref:HTH three-helical bundle domain-containing protein n=2 Tax=Cannabis sativa TaxID=3483 RepID=A0A7J6HNC0_CANSA|nr:uncharacterized protein LOC115711427 [Cannabis sativa]KAF4356732.1 hypothetical protein F8388_010954 [Cannabis sativa]KAF4396178.1 hypothetical protein G4B88_020815 [Cannabis sativa]